MPELSCYHEIQPIIATARKERPKTADDTPAYLTRHRSNEKVVPQGGRSELSGAFSSTSDAIQDVPFQVPKLTTAWRVSLLVC
jgi:hypothetical protein